MPVIGQSNFILAPSADRYLSLANEEFVRRIDLTGFGNNWLRLKVAIHCAIERTGGGNITDGQLFLGLVSGTSQTYQSDACLNAVGFILGNNLNTGTFAWIAGSGNPHYSCSAFAAVRKVGTNYISASVGSATWNIPATGGTLERRGWLTTTIDRTTGAANTAIVSNCGNVNTAVSDVWYEHFLYATNVNFQSSTTTLLETSVTTITQNLSPGVGWDTVNPLDSVCVFWNSLNYALRIYAIACSFTP